MLKSPRMMTRVIVAIATWNPEDRGRSMDSGAMSFTRILVDLF